MICGQLSPQSSSAFQGKTATCIGILSFMTSFAMDGVSALAVDELSRLIFFGKVPIFREDAENAAYGGGQGFGHHLIVAVAHRVIQDGECETWSPEKF